VAIPTGERANTSRVGPRIGFGDAEAHVQTAVGGARQDLLAQSRAAVLDDRVESEDGQVHRAAAVHARPGRGDLLHQQRGLQQAEPTAAVGLGDGDAEPAPVGEGPVELPRELAFGIAFGPVLVGERGGEAACSLSQTTLVVSQLEIHEPSLYRTRNSYI